MVGTVAVIVVGLGAAAAYFDRSNLKAKVEAALAVAENKEAAVKAEVETTLKARLALVKAWAIKEKASVEATLEQVEGHVTQVLARAVADVKKAL